ncbi:MAG: hypothetical protein DWQ44_06530 [Bacteroidetes bacterium]|nr:MAG: hypothetical protein DWQ33_03000 [Bacteroidota bacterium]REK00953.1 MAG: hypothetical protein DWQ39_10295 [Bacteroidota bacterium]REK34556.1 MAG: hypothetical protein DWQ44_06530 [Bacteroidota bacterium]REK51815.1 MAG: hypothetical protein DWQ48_00130 [Bacteroidota bacterium]
MSINDDFNNKAEAEMKMHDAKMMEQAMIRKLAGSPMEERISFALKRNEDDPEKALIYLKDNHMLAAGEHVELADIEKVLESGV